MKFRKFETKYCDRVFRIEEDLPNVGAYLYVFENGKCVMDHLQDTIEICKKFALKEFDIPLDSWTSTDEEF